MKIILLMVLFLFCLVQTINAQTLYTTTITTNKKIYKSGDIATISIRLQNTQTVLPPQTITIITKWADVSNIILTTSAKSPSITISRAITIATLDVTLSNKFKYIPGTAMRGKTIFSAIMNGTILTISPNIILKELEVAIITVRCEVL